MSISDTIGTYIVVPGSLTNWSLVTDSSFYTVNINSVITIRDSLDFGFYPDVLATAIVPNLIGDLPRCDTQINYWCNIVNDGTTIPSGIVHLLLDDSVDFVSSVVPTDSIIGKNIYWHFDSLLFFNQENFNVKVTMPSSLSVSDSILSIFSVYE